MKKMKELWISVLVFDQENKDLRGHLAQEHPTMNFEEGAGGIKVTPKDKNGYIPSKEARKILARVARQYGELYDGSSPHINEFRQYE